MRQPNWGYTHQGLGPLLGTRVSHDHLVQQNLGGSVAGLVFALAQGDAQFGGAGAFGIQSLRKNL